MGGLCGERDEMINPIVSDYSTVAQSRTRVDTTG